MKFNKNSNQMMIGMLVAFIVVVIGVGLFFNGNIRSLEGLPQTTPPDYSKYKTYFTPADVDTVSNWVISHANYHIKNTVQFNGCSEGLLQNGHLVMDNVVESTGKILDVTKSTKPSYMDVNECMNNAIQNDYKYFGLANYGNNGQNPGKVGCYMSKTNKGITDVMADSNNPTLPLANGSVPWQGYNGCSPDQTSGMTVGNWGSVASYSLENASLISAVKQANSAKINKNNTSDQNNGIVLCIMSLASLNSALSSLNFTNNTGTLPSAATSLTPFPQLSNPKNKPPEFNPYSTGFLKKT